MAQQMTPTELKARLDRRDPLTVVDVREPWEVQICRLDNSLHIPMEEIPFRLDELNSDEEYVVVCHQGVRSAAICDWMERQGFMRVSNLAGGLDAWSRTIDPAMRRY
jgi:rhodanese-related sulfurtransferase